MIKELTGLNICPECHALNSIELHVDIHESDNAYIFRFDDYLNIIPIGQGEETINFCDKDRIIYCGKCAKDDRYSKKLKKIRDIVKNKNSNYL